MTLMSQPLPVSPAASTTPPRQGETARLLRLWVSLAWRAAAAAAHGSGDETSLLCSQLHVEQALTDRGLVTADALTELLIWESRLIHHGRGTTSRLCLICRKARLQLPLDLPLPAQREGRR
jgi:hypothetical protein